MEKFVENVLIETSFKDCENGWEKRDSALEILEICYENLSLGNFFLNLNFLNLMSRKN